MTEHLLAGLAGILVLGITAQWVAWRFKLPSILLLLMAGIIAGPVTGVLDVDHLLGDLLFPVVSLSVAIILFEGGLSLRFEDVRGVEKVVQRLVSWGVLITWIISTIAAVILLGVSVQIGLLMGAIVVVTGPTVIIPMLKQIRPSARVASILRWEGIIIDPVGAILAVLVFEEILSGGSQLGIGQAVINLAKTLLIGGVIGILGARLIVVFFGRYWVPDNLQNPVTLMIVIGAFAISNILQAEAGLLTVTVMGIALANQKRIDLTNIIEFKENLQVLLLSALFIILAARIQPSNIGSLGFNIVIFVAIIILVERPLAVWLSTIGSGLNWRERLFIAWMAPRGIVAASVSSVFALELVGHGFEEAKLLVPVTFSVIIATVVIYGLTSGILARQLGLAQSNPQGVLFVGAHEWARKIALELQSAGFRVMLADTNATNTEKALAMGLRIYHGNILGERAEEEIDLSGIGRLVALTFNDDVNSLASIHFRETFGKQDVYQLAPQNSDDTRERVSTRLAGRYLFERDMDYDYLNLRFSTGAEIRAIRIQNARKVEEYLSDKILRPLFVINEANRELVIWSANNPPRLQKGQVLIGMIDPAYTDIFSTQEVALPVIWGVLTERAENIPVHQP